MHQDANLKAKILVRLINLLKDIIPRYYTHSEIDGLFIYAGAPNVIPQGSKPSKVWEWLRAVNLQSAELLRILQVILEDFLEKDPQFLLDNEEKSQNFIFGAAKSFKSSQRRKFDLCQRRRSAFKRW